MDMDIVINCGHESLRGVCHLAAGHVTPHRYKVTWSHPATHGCGCSWELIPDEEGVRPLWIRHPDDNGGRCLVHG